MSVNAISNYAKKRVAQTKTHLHKVYGPNLAGMFKEDGKVNYKNMLAARHRPVTQEAVLVEPIYGLGTIDAEAAQAWWYGAAKGLQYKGMESATSMDMTSLKNAEQSECFYAVYGMVDTFDMAAYDFANVVADGSFNWFNVGMYDPLHMTGDMSISYQ